MKKLIITIILLIIIIGCSTKTKLVRVRLVKIHSVADYAKQQKQSFWLARYPYVVYEIIETGERYTASGSPLCKTNEIITIRMSYWIVVKHAK